MLKLLSLAMQLLLTATRAKLVQLQPTRIVTFVLGGGIIALLAIVARKVDNYTVCFLRHLTTRFLKKSKPLKSKTLKKGTGRF